MWTGGQNSERRRDSHANLNADWLDQIVDQTPEEDERAPAFNPTTYEPDDPTTKEKQKAIAQLVSCTVAVFCAAAAAGLYVTGWGPQFEKIGLLVISTSAAIFWALTFVKDPYKFGILVKRIMWFTIAAVFGTGSAVLYVAGWGSHTGQLACVLAAAIATIIGYAHDPEENIQEDNIFALIGLAVAVFVAICITQEDALGDKLLLVAISGFIAIISCLELEFITRISKVKFLYIVFLYGWLFGWALFFLNAPPAFQPVLSPAYQPSWSNLIPTEAASDAITNISAAISYAGKATVTGIVTIIGAIITFVGQIIAIVGQIIVMILAGFALLLIMVFSPTYGGAAMAILSGIASLWRQRKPPRNQPVAFSKWANDDRNDISQILED